jgi:hypothetical protein
LAIWATLIPVAGPRRPTKVFSARSDPTVPPAARRGFPAHVKRSSRAVAGASLWERVAGHLHAVGLWRGCCKRGSRSPSNRADVRAAAPSPKQHSPNDGPQLLLDSVLRKTNLRIREERRGLSDRRRRGLVRRPGIRAERRPSSRANRLWLFGAAQRRNCWRGAGR